MSRRRKSKLPQQPRPLAGPHKPQVRNTHAERPSLIITIKMLADGRMEVDPKYNDAAMEHLDVLYGLANREDYDPVDWSDDHKIAFFISDMMAGFLAQWEAPDEGGGIDDGGTIPGVLHINESPVVDRFDLADMELARSGGQQNE